jgi:hypothetical protein
MSRPSKTDLPCDCGSLDRAAKDPDHPIAFDARLNEFNYVREDAKFRIYHCPFCGGKAPESLRSSLYSQVSRHEQERLFRVADPCRNLQEVIASLGTPDIDVPMGSWEGKPEHDGQASQVSAYRRLTYTKVSDSADLSFDLHPDGRVASYSVGGKYVGLPGETG